MMYAQYDKKGNIIAYSNAELDNMVLIPEDIYSDTMHEQYVIVNKEFVLKENAPENIDNEVKVRGSKPKSVDAHKRYLINDVNNLFQNTYALTPDREYIYKAKEEEAIAFLKDVDPWLDDYPFIKYESEVRNTTPQEVALLYLHKAKESKQKLAVIEAKRQAKIIAINAATTIEEVESAYKG